MKTQIIFMGTPYFSVPALKSLAARDDYNISLVVTQPDRPKGRGKKIVSPPVKIEAIELGIPVIQPEKINTPEIKTILASHNADYFVVVAFGQILSKELLDIPKKYPINIHASLLPKYRGASPIQAAIANMDKHTGVTTMIMEKTMDTGDILLTESMPIPPEYTAQDLHDDLSNIGGNLIVQTIDKINANSLEPRPQDNSMATYVPLLQKEHGNINWSNEPLKIIAHIHAMTPWPGAFSFLGDQRIKIFRAIPGGKTEKAPGEIIELSSRGIHVSTKNGSVIITEIMGRSGKRLAADAFLRGNKINLPSRFHNGHVN